MSRLLVFCALVLAVVAGVAVRAVPVRADAGPHVMGDGTPASTDRCAGCHRAHTAKGKDYLFVAGGTSIAAFCTSCHDGSGATTNVVDGTIRGTSTGLKGGGFDNATMDTNWDGSSTSQPTTSRHVTDGLAASTLWGNAPSAAGRGWPGSR